MIARDFTGAFRRFVGAAVLFVASVGLGATAVRAECRADQVDLRGSWGQMRFSVEVADDPRERARGLMFRESMGNYNGMLFVYEFPQKVAFWMKNTLIPLDMIFVDEQGQVAHVHHEAVPGDLSPIPGGDNIFAVLEINGGLARRFGIGPGDVMRHPSFQTDPIWPC